MLEAQAEKRKVGKVTVWASVPGFLTVDTPTSQHFQDFTLAFAFEIKLINVTECSLSIALFLSLCFLCVIHLILS